MVNWSTKILTVEITDFINGQPSHGGDRIIFEVMTPPLPNETLGSVTSLLAATLYQGNTDRNHKLWNIKPDGEARF
jgi:hypothetical protein